MEIAVKEILRIRNKLNNIYQKHLTKPHTKEELVKHMDRDKFMEPEEALEFGIIDRILTRREDEDQNKVE